MSLNDSAAVREQYETEAGLAARRAVYREVSGPDPRAAVFDAVAERGEASLRRHFETVERRAADGTVTFRDAEQIRSYLRSSRALARGADRVGELTEPLVARRRPVVFVAEKAA